MALAPERIPLIGGSDVAAILGRSPWGSAWEVWARIKLGVHNDSDSAPMRRGRRFERAIADEVGVRLKESIDYQPAMFVHENGWACASVDGFIGTDGVLEIKIPGGDQRDKWGADGTALPAFQYDEAVVPPHYALQAYWYMHLTGRAYTDFAVAFTSFRDGLDDPIIIRLYADPDAQAAIFEAVTAWRDRYIVGDEEPALDGSDACRDYLTGKFPGAAEKVERPASEGELSTMLLHADLGRQIKELEAQRDALGNRLRESIGNDYALTADGVKATLSLASETRRVAGLGDIAKKRPDLADALEAAGLINTTISRTLRVVRKESK